jgi:hypothetical protein
MTACAGWLVVGWLLGCGAEATPAPEMTPSPHTAAAAWDAEHWAAYPWLEPEGGDWTPLEAVYAPPDGFSRVAVAQGSFDAWLRGVPVAAIPAGGAVEVRAYDGRILRRPADRIIPLDVGTRDLQQCADSAIRLHAEFLRSSGRTDVLGYHFTSGDLSTWNDWLGGERFAVAGSSVGRISGPARSDSAATWRAWLELVFTYAGTRSLAHDTDAVALGAPLRAGDVFVHAGSPGHAVVLLDIAEDDTGQRVALVGQGFMPAEDFHVIRDHGRHVLQGVWFGLPDDGAVLQTPWGPFGRNQARRFRSVDGETVASGAGAVDGPGADHE